MRMTDQIETRATTLFGIPREQLPALRPYQQKALESVCEQYAQGVRRQLIAMPTGSGKTIVFANLPSYLPLKGQMLVLAHRDELLEQAAEKLRHWNPHLNVSIEQADHYADPEADVIIASVATLGRKVSKRRERFDWSRITKLVIDECFVPDTLVDGRPIQEIQEGETVSAFDERTGQIVRSTVTRIFRNHTSRLVRITAGDRTVVCTPNHPFWTTRGWVNAGNLTASDELHLVRSSDSVSDKVPERQDESRRSSLLLTSVRQSLREESLVNHDGSDKSQVRIGANEKS